MGAQWDVHKAVEDAPKLIKASRRRLATRARYIALAIAVSAVVATGLLAPLPSLAPGVEETSPVDRREAHPVPARSRRSTKLVRHQWTVSQQPRLVRQPGQGGSEGRGRRRRGLELPGGAGHEAALVSTQPGARGEGRQAGQPLALVGQERLPEPDSLARYPARVGGYWSSGYPRMDLAAKDEEGFAAGLQLLLLRADLSQLKAYLQAMPDADWSFQVQARHNVHLAGRDPNRSEFKPGTRTILLQFSDTTGEQGILSFMRVSRLGVLMMQVARFPWYHRFAPLIEPLLQQVLGEQDMANIVRMQLALMPPHTQVRLHLDSGPWAHAAHRIHLVVATNPDVRFAECQADSRADIVTLLAGLERAAAEPDPLCLPIHAAEEGLVFELNNRLRHFVVNRGDTPRIHLVVDVAETPRQPVDLQPGQKCAYRAGKIVCLEE